MKTLKFWIPIIAINLSLNCNRDNKNVNTSIVKNELTCIDSSNLFWHKILERYSPDISDYYPYIVTWQKGDSTITYHILSYSKDSLELAYLSNCSIKTSIYEVTIFFERFYKVKEVDSCYKKFNINKIRMIQKNLANNSSKAIISITTGEGYIIPNHANKFFKSKKEIDSFYRQLVSISTPLAQNHGN